MSSSPYCLVTLLPRRLIARLQAHWAGAAVLAGFLLLGLIYSLTTPVFEAPDELYHFEYARHIARTGTLPDMRAAVRPWAQEGSQPPLYYLTVAMALRTLAPATWDAPVRLNPHAHIGLPEGHENKNRVVHTADEQFPFRGLARAVHVARLASLAWAGLGVAGMYALGWLTLGRPSCDTPIRKGDPSTVVPLAVALVAALPQFAFISGAISNDPAIMATTAWALTALWYAGQRAPSPRLGGLVGLAAGLMTLCKLSGLLMAVFGLAVLMVSWRPWARERRYWAGLAVYAITVALVGGWWYARNLALYGDPTGLNLMLEIVGRYRYPPSWAEVIAQFQGVWRSFWGVFGWFNIELPAWIYAALGGVVLAVVAGGLLRLLREARTAPSPAGLPIGWLLLWVGIVLTALANWIRITPGAQGRLIFPALPALAVLAAWSWQGWHRRWGVWAGWGMVAGLATLSIAVPFTVIRPAYQPPPVLTALPDNAVPLNVTYGQAIHLLGYQVTQPRASQWGLTPGDELTVTLFWHSEVPLTDDYSVFVHLIGSDGLIITQDDSFPAGGAWATSQWPVDIVVVDEHQINVPVTTYAPDEVTLHVGLYRFETGERLPSFPPAVEDSVPLLTMRIEPRPGALPNATCVNFGNQLTLVGYELEKRVLPARDAIRMTLYWRVDHPPDRLYTSFAQVVGENDRIWGQRDTPPVPESGRWEPGQVVSDHKEFQVSQDTPPGLYELRIGVYDSKTHELLETVPGPGCITMDPVTLTRVRVLPRVR